MQMSMLGVLRTPPVVIRMKHSHRLLQRKSDALGPLPLGSLQLLCRNYGYSHSLLQTLCPVELHELHVAVQSSCSAYSSVHEQCPVTNSHVYVTIAGEKRVLLLLITINKGHDIQCSYAVQNVPSSPLITPVVPPIYHLCFVCLFEPVELMTSKQAPLHYSCHHSCTRIV